MSRTRASLVLRVNLGAKNCCNVSVPSAAGCPPISSLTETRRMPGSFFDTNVLVYLASADAGKADRAEAAITAGGVISVQVLNEFTNVARRKMQMSWSDIHAFLTLLRGLLTVHPLTLEIHETGFALAERYGLSDLRRHDCRLGTSGRLRHAVVGRHAAWHGSRRTTANHQSFSCRGLIVSKKVEGGCPVTAYCPVMSLSTEALRQKPLAMEP